MGSLSGPLSGNAQYRLPETLFITKLQHGGFVVSRSREGCIPEQLFAASIIDEAFSFIRDNLGR